MRLRNILIIMAIGLSLALVGCGSTTVKTPRKPSAPVTLTQAQARAQYDLITTPYEVARQQFVTDLGNL